LYAPVNVGHTVSRTLRVSTGFRRSPQESAPQVHQAPEENPEIAYRVSVPRIPSKPHRSAA
jgi:hypothetical protein